jgi:hypothetical protein
MNKPCKFSADKLQFEGTPAEQAQCLLRRVLVGGNVDDAPAQVPQVLLSRVGTAVDFTRSQIEAYLALKGIAARDIGGPLAAGVSTTPGGQKALYFVIHDTSDELPGNTFFRPTSTMRRGRATIFPAATSAPRMCSSIGSASPQAGTITPSLGGLPSEKNNWLAR